MGLLSVLQIVYIHTIHHGIDVQIEEPYYVVNDWIAAADWLPPAAAEPDPGGAAAHRVRDPHGRRGLLQVHSSPPAFCYMCYVCGLADSAGSLAGICASPPDLSTPASVNIIICNVIQYDNRTIWVDYMQFAYH